MDSDTTNIDAPADGRQEPAGSDTGGSDGIRQAIPIGGGLVYGSVTFIGNYLAVFALYILELVQFGPRPAFSVWWSYGPFKIYHVAGWLFYGAHSTPVEYWPEVIMPINFLDQVYGFAGIATRGDVTEAQAFALEYFFGGHFPRLQETTYGLALEHNLLIPKVAFLAVPVVGLFLGSRALARRAVNGNNPTVTESMIAGASIALGYGVLAIGAAILVFGVSVDGGSLWGVTPNLQSVVTMMGVVYPVLIGAVAGYISNPSTRSFDIL